MIITWQTRHLRRSDVATRACGLATVPCEAYGEQVPPPAVPAGEGAAKPPMGNQSEPLINLVSCNGEKHWNARPKGQVAREWRCYDAAPPLVARPGKRGSLKEELKVDLTVPVKPVGSHCGQNRGGILRAIKGEGPAGRGRQRKLKPSCNGRDRAMSGNCGVGIPNLKGCRLLPGSN